MLYHPLCRDGTPSSTHQYIHFVSTNPDFGDSMKTCLYRSSNLITFLASGSLQKSVSGDQLLQTGFLRVYWSGRYITYTTRDHSSWESAFIIGFSCTVWTKNEILGWLISWWCASWRHFNSFLPTETAHKYGKGKLLSKKVRKLVTQKPFTSKWEKEL